MKQATMNVNDQNEIYEVIKLLERLNYLNRVKFATTTLPPINFCAVIDKSDYKIRGIEVQKFIENIILGEIKEITTRLAEYSIKIED